MTTWLRRMRFLSAVQTAITALRVLATASLALTAVRAGNMYRMKRKGH